MNKVETVLVFLQTHKAGIEVLSALLTAFGGLASLVISTIALVISLFSFKRDRAKINVKSDIEVSEQATSLVFSVINTGRRSTQILGYGFIVNGREVYLPNSALGALSENEQKEFKMTVERFKAVYRKDKIFATHYFFRSPLGIHKRRIRFRILK